MNCFQIYEQTLSIDLKKQKRNQKIKFYLFFSLALLFTFFFKKTIFVYYIKYCKVAIVFNYLKIIVIPLLAILIVSFIFLILKRSFSFENHFIIRQNIRVALRKFYLEITSNNNLDNYEHLNFIINQFKREIQLKDKKTNQLAHEEFIKFIEQFQKKHDNINYELLQHIYHEFGFYKSTITMTKSKKWYNKTKAFYILQLLRFENSLYLIKPYINDKNKKLALSAFLSYVIISNDGELIKKTYNKNSDLELPLATKIKIVNVLLNEGMNSFNFIDFIESSNSNVLKIAVFYATKKNIALDLTTITNLLNHKDALVRKEVYHHIRILKIKNTSKLLFSNYDIETERNKISILKTIEVFEDINDMQLLFSLSLKENQTEVNYFLVKTIFKIQPNSINLLKKNLNKNICKQLDDIVNEFMFKKSYIIKPNLFCIKNLKTELCNSKIIINCKYNNIEKSSILKFA